MNILDKEDVRRKLIQYSSDVEKMKQKINSLQNAFDHIKKNLFWECGTVLFDRINQVLVVVDDIAIVEDEEDDNVSDFEVGYVLKSLDNGLFSFKDPNSGQLRLCIEEDVRALHPTEWVKKLKWYVNLETARVVTKNNCNPKEDFIVFGNCEWNSNREVISLSINYNYKLSNL